jgi:hypothetical protein
LYLMPPSRRSRGDDCLLGATSLLPSRPGLVVLALVRPRGDGIALGILVVGYVTSMAISRRDVPWPY